MITKDRITIDIHESRDLIIYKLLWILTSLSCIKLDPYNKFTLT